MCKPKAPKMPPPPAPPAPPAPPPPELQEDDVVETKKNNAARTGRGRSSLRIDRTISALGSGGSLNIPK